MAPTPRTMAPRAPARRETAGPLSCPACLQPLPEQPGIRGADRLHGTPGSFDVVICRACGTGLTFPLVADDDLPRLYPDDYNAYALPGSPAMRLAATILFRWRYWR